MRGDCGAEHCGGIVEFGGEEMDAIYLILLAIPESVSKIAKIKSISVP